MASVTALLLVLLVCSWHATCDIMPGRSSGGRQLLALGDCAMCRPKRKRCFLPRAWPQAVFVPQPQCARYLEVQQVDTAGLGHSFFAFNHMISLAAAHGLTLRANFTTSDHGIPPERVQQYFFGTVFSPAAPPASCRVQTLHNPDLLKDLVLPARRTCADQPCLVFRLTGRILPKPLIVHVPMYRKVFTAPERQESRVHMWPRAHVPGPGPLIIAVHIRRGDVAQGRGDAFQAWSRIVPNVAYEGLLRSVFEALQLPRPGAAAPARVVFYCQGMRSAMLVPDFDGTLTDFGPLLRRYGVEASIGASDSVDAFDGMCNAAVLITSKSGMSHMVAVLCGRPVVLAIPFWHSYDCVPNALRLKGTPRPSFVPGLNRTVSLPHKYTFEADAFLRLVEAQGLDGYPKPAPCCPRAAQPSPGASPR